MLYFLVLSDYSLNTIYDELGEAKCQWFKIGDVLGIPHDKLQEFRNQEDSLRTMIEYCQFGDVDGVGTPLTWTSVVTALKSSDVGRSGLAKKIEQKYCPIIDHDGEVIVYHLRQA